VLGVFREDAASKITELAGVGRATQTAVVEGVDARGQRCPSTADLPGAGCRSPFIGGAGRLVFIVVVAILVSHLDNGAGLLLLLSGFLFAGGHECRPRVHPVAVRRGWGKNLQSSVGHCVAEVLVTRGMVI